MVDRDKYIIINKNNKVMETNVLNEQTKQRPGFVTFWLWLGIIMNVVLALIMVSVFTTNNTLPILSLILALLIPVMDIVGSILLLNWKKFGFWLKVISGVIFIAIILFSYKSFSESLDYIIIAVISPIILLAILQIQKDGISCWKQLE